MTRQTSAVAFQQIQANGLLSAMRFRVYQHLYRHGPLTGVELNAGLKEDVETSPSYHKRLSELLTIGVVQTVGTRTCTVTGQVATLWDVTMNLPNGVIAPKKNVSRPSKVVMASALADLRSHYQAGAKFSPETVVLLKWIGELTK